MDEARKVISVDIRNPILHGPTRKDVHLLIWAGKKHVFPIPDLAEGDEFIEDVTVSEGHIATVQLCWKDGSARRCSLIDTSRFNPVNKVFFHWTSMHFDGEGYEGVVAGVNPIWKTGPTGRPGEKTGE
jgi:hypothetical protein